MCVCVLPPVCRWGLGRHRDPRAPRPRCPTSYQDVAPHTLAPISHINPRIRPLRILASASWERGAAGGVTSVRA